MLTQPIKLMTRIILIATNPGDLVLDCFGGSGTTAVVAQNFGRRWVMIESNPEYNEIARLRLKNVRVPMPLELVQSKLI